MSVVPSRADPIVTAGRRPFATAILVLLALIVAGFAIAGLKAAPPDGVTRGDTWRFVGRWHPALVHFPIGLIALVPLLEIAGLPRRFRHLQTSAGFVLWLAVLGTVLAVALGYTLSRADGFKIIGDETLHTHMKAGLVTAAVGLLALGLRGRSLGPRVTSVRGASLDPSATAIVVLPRRRPLATIGYALCLAWLLVSVSFAGHLGGQLTYGDSYFSEVAPPAIAKFLGPVEHDDAPAPPAKADGPTTISVEPALPPPPPMPSPTTVPTSEPTTSPVTLLVVPVTFAETIAPMLNENCVSCHGPARMKGSLRLDTHGDLMAGGESGACVVPGDVAASDLVNRMTLPRTDDEVMPPANAGHRPTPEQIAAVKRWIADGARS